MPTLYSNILCQAQQHLIKSSHHLDIASHETNAACNPSIQCWHNKPKEYKHLLSFTHQDSFPSPFPSPTHNNNQLQLQLPSSLISISIVLHPQTLFPLLQLLQLTAYLRQMKSK